MRPYPRSARPVGNRSAKLILVSLLSSLLAFAPALHAAMQIFVLSEEIQGESKDPVFPNSIEIESLHWDVIRESGGSVGGGGAETPSFSDLIMVKKVDNSSPDFFMQLVTGNHWNDLTIVLRRSGEEPLEYYALRLSEVRVSSYSTGGSEDEDILTENITLNFSKVEMFYRPQKEDGSGGEIKGVCYDLKANVDC